jgi:integrase
VPTPQVRRVIPLGQPNADLSALLADFLTQYTNPITKTQNAQRLNHLFRTTGKRHPGTVTEAELFTWCTGDGKLANNTVRQRLSTVRTFYRWCQESDVVEKDPTTRLLALRRSYPKTYGKVQAHHAGRWLSKEDAFTTLLAPCQDGTPPGMRDELAIRLGLTGIRNAEICHMTWGNYDAHTGRLHWTGKGKRPREVTLGDTTRKLVTAWRTLYTTGIARRPNGTDPILCTQVMGAQRQQGPARIHWLSPLSQRCYFRIVTSRAEAAGLGHVAPHDLRRSAAGILHHTVSDDGAHRYDLLDIQKVLGHADPATTMRSYLDPMDTDVIDRAADDLD